VKNSESNAALLPCIDYLHGDVVDSEFLAACYYEYARESVVLRETAGLWVSKKHSTKELDEILMAIEKRFPGGIWWSLVWRSPSFPRKNWNQLSPRERANILQWFPSIQIQPIQVNEVWYLVTRGVIQQLNTMAEQAIETYRSGKPQRKVYPIVEGPVIENVSRPRRKERVSWVHVIFCLDFGKTKKRLVQEFDKWLQLPENKVRFDAHKQNPTGKTGAFKDRLKDLAAWRLYRGLGCEKALEFVEKNRKRDENGKPRQFHDARKEQSKTKMPLNEAPLYSAENQESQFLKAKGRARNYLAELFPWESGEDVEKMRNEVAKCFRPPPRTSSKDF
jgi:hypothetical protein